MAEDGQVSPYPATSMAGFLLSVTGIGYLNKDIDVTM
jgi:hypothetical protein